MKKMISVLFFCVLCAMTFTLQAQCSAKFWVQFKDKNNSPYSIERPKEFLSPRAVELRRLHHVAIDERDLPVNESYVRQVVELGRRMRVMTRSKWLNGVTVYAEDTAVLSLIRQLPFVQYAELTAFAEEPEKWVDTTFYYAPPKLKKTEKKIQPAGKTEPFRYGVGMLQLSLNNGQWLHRMGLSGKGVWMMVMDGGFNGVDTLTMFQSLRQEGRLLGARNLVSSYDTPLRRYSHGTNVLSCIAAYEPGRMVGAAPDVSVFLCKTEDGRGEYKVEEDNWVAGVELADSLGCQLVNASLGYTTFDDTNVVRDYSVLNGKTSRASLAASIAAEKGLVICCSAGNAGQQPWRHISTPADAEHVLAVGAVDAQGRYAPFSSQGPTADGRVKPDACALGVNCFVIDHHNDLHRASGTSFASPIMAGLVACLIQAFPHRSAFDIIDAVRQSGDQALHCDSLRGYGIPDMLNAYHRLSHPASPDTIVTFDCFVATRGIISFVVNDKTVTSSSDLRVEVKEVHGRKLKYGMLVKQIDEQTSRVTLFLPGVRPPKQLYRFLDVKIKIRNHVSHYRIGQHIYE